MATNNHVLNNIVRLKKWKLVFRVETKKHHHAETGGVLFVYERSTLWGFVWSSGFYKAHNFDDTRASIII